MCFAVCSLLHVLGMLHTLFHVLDSLHTHTRAHTHTHTHTHNDVHNHNGHLHMFVAIEMYKLLIRRITGTIAVLNSELK